jgi:hypothetical protein
VNCRGFSLIETIIAVGIFAGAGLALVALMSVSARRVAETEERLVAQGLPDAVTLAVHALVGQRGFDSVATGAALNGAPSDSGLFLTAGRGGTDLRPQNGAAIGRDEFFAVQVCRFGGGPLAYDPAAAWVAFVVHVSWPYRGNAASAEVTPMERRQRVSFPIVLNR